ncbi:hypothetical protein AAKU55_000688 [Oxalobacteraceae bacterium GrIS 1.11]
MATSTNTLLAALSASLLLAACGGGAGSTPATGTSASAGTGAAGTGTTVGTGTTADAGATAATAPVVPTGTVVPSTPVVPTGTVVPTSPVVPAGTLVPSTVPTLPPTAPQLVIATFEAAQTHVLPEAGLNWTLPHATGALHLAAQRDVFLMLDLGAAKPTRPMLEAWFNNIKLGAVALNAPDKLPPTEAAGPAYASNRYSNTLPAAWIKPGLMLRVAADNYTASDFKKPEIGLDSDFDMRILPFYLFGANDANTQPFSVTGNPDAATRQELYAKWPVARLNMVNHPAKRIDWPYMIIGPVEATTSTVGVPAYRVTNHDQEHGGYEIMGATLGILSAIRDANGESNTNNQYYAPLLMLGADGKYSDPWGGLGGGSRGTGDYRYGGIFIHEQGHAFGMPHADDGYKNGAYPYIHGSLLGSSWGYDAGRATLLAPVLPKDASTYANCQGTADRIKDAGGHCVKQDPMQGGSGDQAAGYRFTMFSDFNAGLIQRYFEGQTSVDKAGVHQYSGGKIIVDPASSTGYSQWDGIDKKRVEVVPSTTDKGLYGFDMGLPIQRNVAVQTLIITYSLAGTANVSQIYPPLSYVGNLRRQIDPTVAAQRAQIVPNTGPVPWYCHASGCDYTVRVSYADGSVQHILLQGGARNWFSPSGAIPAEALDPLKGKSFMVWGLNVAAGKAISKIDLLDTPMGWNGIGGNPTVLLSKTL